MPATTQTGMPAWRATAAAARDPATPTHPPGTEGGRLEQHQVAVGDRGAEARHRDVDRVDLGPLQPPHEAAALTERVDHEDVEVAAARQRVADLLGPSEDADRRLVGDGVRQLVGRRVVGDLVRGAPRLADRVVRGQHPGRQPPQRTRRRDGGR